MKRSDVFRVALFALALVPLAAPAATAAGDVRVRVPYGVNVEGSTTSDAPDGTVYVTVTGLRFPNPSMQAQSYRATDLHLLVGGHVFTPVARPHLGAIDTIEPGIIGPHETLELSVTFRVPASTASGDFEFTPRWSDDSGRTVDFCCYYL